MGEYFSQSNLPERRQDESPQFERVVAPNLEDGADIATHLSDLPSAEQGRRDAEAKARELRSERMEITPSHIRIGQIAYALTYYRQYELANGDTRNQDSDGSDYILAA
jgi:hypothetical protein